MLRRLPVVVVFVAGRSRVFVVADDFVVLADPAALYDPVALPDLVVAAVFVPAELDALVDLRVRIY